jgi:hypothetical protein
VQIFLTANAGGGQAVRGNRAWKALREAYSKIENLVLWARSEKIGFAVNPACSEWSDGVLEYWVLWKDICLYRVGTEQKISRLQQTAYDPQYSMFLFFHYSITPLILRGSKSHLR